jgi:putative endonuclease
VYLVRCRDDSLYVGITTNLAKRLAMHNAGTGAKYTRSRRPVELAYSRVVRSGTTARRLEVAFKRLDRKLRLRLVAGDAGVLRDCLRHVKQMARNARGQR